MNVNELAGWFVLLAPILATAGGLIGAALVRNYQPVREVAVFGAPYVDAIANAVDYAEKYGLANKLPGADKFAIAVKQMDKWLEEQGIHGDGKTITLVKVRADIELMRARLFPAKPAA